MKELRNIVTSTYDATLECGHEFGWMVGIVIDEDMYQAYLYRTDIGFKMHMFGVDRSSCDYDSFVYTVKCNLYDYKELYLEQINE